jgi:hypothetical protein
MRGNVEVETSLETHSLGGLSTSELPVTFVSWIGDDKGFPLPDPG